jgi:SAM-dependent methyltransferase
MAQLDTVVAPERLFRHYVYTTGTSSTMRAHFQGLAREVAAAHALRGRLVVEIGSNDGTLLSALGPGVRVLGVEPARNVAELARSRGVPTVAEFFCEQLALQQRGLHGEAAVILANNVVAHVHDLVGLLRGVRAWLAEDGVFVMEAPHLLPMVDHVEFDTIYHEHLSYLSLHALEAAAGRAGLRVLEVRDVAVHGGSLRVTLGHGGRTPTGSVEACRRREASWGILEAEPYARFASRVGGVLTAFPALLRARKAAGRHVVGYGAAAKANTLLCAAGVDTRLMAQVVDRNPLKQGLLTPGTRIPVVGPEALRPSADLDVVVLAWNLVEEIRAELGHLESAGAGFLVPIPEPRVL